MQIHRTVPEVGYFSGLHISEHCPLGSVNDALTAAIGADFESFRRGAKEKSHDDPGGLSSLAYFRLHGSPRRYYSSYGAEFLDRLVLKVRDLPATRDWCIFDNTASAAAIQKALALNARIQP